jgi:hypothetical protein
VETANRDGLFFINIESNLFISSIIVVSGGVVMCMDGGCWRNRPPSLTWASGEIGHGETRFPGVFYSANEDFPKTHFLFRHFQSTTHATV